MPASAAAVSASAAGISAWPTAPATSARRTAPTAVRSWHAHSAAPTASTSRRTKSRRGPFWTTHAGPPRRPRLGTARASKGTRLRTLGTARAPKRTRLARWLPPYFLPLSHDLIGLLACSRRTEPGPWSPVGVTPRRRLRLWLYSPRRFGLELPRRGPRILYRRIAAHAVSLTVTLAPGREIPLHIPGILACGLAELPPTAPPVVRWVWRLLAGSTVGHIWSHHLLLLRLGSKRTARPKAAALSLLFQIAASLLDIPLLLREWNPLGPCRLLPAEKPDIVIRPRSSRDAPVRKPQVGGSRSHRQVPTHHPRVAYFVSGDVRHPLESSAPEIALGHTRNAISYTGISIYIPNIYVGNINVSVKLISVVVIAPPPPPVERLVRRERHPSDMSKADADTSAPAIPEESD